MPESSEPDLRVLVLAPSVRDGRLTQSLLQNVGLTCMVCDDMPQLTAEIRIGVGTVLITDSVLTDGDAKNLVDTIRDQPAWSDVPVVVLARSGGLTTAASHALGLLTNVTMLERPTAMRSLLSAVQAAMRARARQIEIGALLQREQSARLELERAGRMKDEFLATLSHELRTPLTAILGWSQIIRRMDADKAIVQEGVNVIEKNARVQVKLIEDLLDMSRIISGKVSLELTTVDIVPLLMTAIDTVKPSAEMKGVQMELSIDADAGSVTGDAGRLQQVFWNILTNALKFTPRGGRVKVHASRTGEWTQVDITDDGIGMDPDFVPYVFDRFRQADSSTTRSHGGLGLGLAIVKNLLDLHGGVVSAHSDGKNKGSVFRISLPLRAANEPAKEAVAASPAQTTPTSSVPSLSSLSNLKVLVVDDERDTREMVRRVLERCEARVVTASSVDEALELVNSEHPDVLVSDIGMPVRDGYDLLRTIRARERKGSAIHPLPALALTAFARSEDRTRALRAGFLEHLTKPIEPDELVATVASLAGR